VAGSRPRGPGARVSGCGPFKRAFGSDAERDELITGFASSEATTMRKWALSSALLLLFLLTTLPGPGMYPPLGVFPDF